MRPHARHSDLLRAMHTQASARSHASCAHRGRRPQGGAHLHGLPRRVHAQRANVAKEMPSQKVLRHQAGRSSSASSKRFGFALPTTSERAISGPPCSSKISTSLEAGIRCESTASIPSFLQILRRDSRISGWPSSVSRVSAIVIPVSFRASRSGCRQRKPS